jgi:hypothetical protein
MNTNNVSLAHLSDDQLLVRVKELVREERAATAGLLVHLAEMEERQLHCREGCSSLFSYCVEVLHLSEPAAYRRVKAARLAKRFPIVIAMLAEGSIHLAALDVLAAHLTDANHVEVLAEARHKTKREIEDLATRLRPLPDVPSAVRKLPGPIRIEARLEPVRAERMPEGIPAGAESVRVRTGPADATGEHQLERGGSASIPGPRPADRPVVAPLSPSRYRVQFTATGETYQKLRQVQELLRHQVPDGDPATIMDAALTLLLEKLLREKTGATIRPRRKKPPVPGSGEGHVGKPSESRHIPADVKRAVWRRDRGRCAFTAANGRRCSSRGPLEFHHVEPYLLGGRATIGNIALRCRAHNAYEGMLVFGERQTRNPGRQCPELSPGRVPVPETPELSPG